MRSLIVLPTVLFLFTSRSLALFAHRPAIDALLGIETSNDNGGSIYTLCDNPDSHLLKAHNVEIIPETPTVGQDIQVNIKGTAVETVSSGKVVLEASYGFIKFNKEFDLCSLLSDYTNEKCALAEGDHEITTKSSIPDGIPALPVKAKVRAYNQDDKLLTCVEVHFTLKSK